MAPARWTLPRVVDPPDRICFQIEVPDDPFHIAAFLGAIFDLSKPYKWQNDNAHTALQVGEVWQQIFLALRRNNCPKIAPIGAGAEVENMIRQNPDNPCLLETSIDGTNWCAFADLSLCLKANPSQPGPGGEGPGPGQSVDYCTTLQGGGKFILPVPVTAGSVLTISQRSGGWNDGTANWFCSDGANYSLGLCVGVGGFDGSDPLPSSKHMSLVVEIDGTWYDTNSPVIIPAGTGSVDAVFQANDSSLGDNSGSINFCVNVKNVTQPTFTHHFDFRDGLHGWEIRTSGAAAPFPYFNPGVGIQCDNPGGPPGVGLFEIGLNMPGTFTGLTVRYVATVADNADGQHGIYNIGAPFNWGSTVETFLASAVPNIDLTAVFTQPSEAIKLNADAASLDTSCVITDAWISGPGADPF